MKIPNHLNVAFLLLLLSCACSSPGTEPSYDNSPPGQEDTETPPAIIPGPVAAQLLYPENNTECMEGEIIDEIHSDVTFRWNPSENTDSYYLEVINLLQNNIIPVNTADTESTVTLRRNTPYKWHIVSKSENTDKTATSPVWQFYNSGPGVISHSPFPATLVYPRVGEVLEYGDDPIYLEWSGSDVDNDIVIYEIFFGTDPVPAVSQALTTDTRHHVSYEYQLGTEYFWQIKTTDGTGNSSWSQIFNFIVN